MSKTQFLEKNLKSGEIYAGLVLGMDEKPDEHLVLLPGNVVGVSWEKAVKWADSIGGRLPTRQELSILFANCKPHLIKRWHWSCETHESDASYAWGCGFNYGGQDYYRKSYEGAAVAVRTIQLSA